MRTSHVSPKTDYNYQAAALDDVDGGCLSDCKPRFRAISQDYFANEAPFLFGCRADSTPGRNLDGSTGGSDKPLCTAQRSMRLPKHLVRMQLASS